MKPQTPQEASVPTEFDGPVNVKPVHGDLILDAEIVEWTDHGIVIVYADPLGTIGNRIRRFIPFATLSGISVVVGYGEEA